MKVWRGFTLTLWVALLSICAAFIIHYHALQSTVLDTNKATSWLAQSNTYEKMRDEFLSAQVVSAIQQKAPDNKLIDLALIKSAVAEVLPREELIKRIQPAVTSTYKWLDSKEPEVTFSITLADKKDAFYKALETKLGVKIKGLVDCGDYRYPPEEALLNDLCLPAYATSEEATQALMGYMRASDLSLGDTITQESFAIPVSQLRIIKQLPTYLNFLWTFNLIAIAILAVVSLFLIVTRKSLGVLAIGVSLLGAGILVGITAPIISSSLKPAATDGVAAIVTSVLNTFVPKFIAVDIQLALLCAGSGAVIVVGSVLWRTKRKKKHRGSSL